MSQVELLQRAWLKIVMVVILFQIWKYISRWQATEGYWLQNKTEQWKITEIPKSNSDICWELKPSRSNSRIGLDNYSVKVGGPTVSTTEHRSSGALCCILMKKNEEMVGIRNKINGFNIQNGKGIYKNHQSKTTEWREVINIDF